MKKHGGDQLYIQAESLWTGLPLNSSVLQKEIVTTIKRPGIKLLIVLFAILPKSVDI